MTTATSQDTEITLGTGKMLALFFGLVALCAVFFGFGFSLGKNSVLRSSAADSSTTAIVTTGGTRPSAVKATEAPPATANQNAGGQLIANSQAATPPVANSAAATSPDPTAAPSDPTALPPVNGYYVQVAAVSKPEDADALVDALKKKQYPAFSTNVAPDKLFHVQVGPYADIKDAEAMRSKLVSDGYNPILKK